MAAPIRAFFHSSQVSTPRLAVGDAFAPANVHNHNLLADVVAFMAGRAFNYAMEAIVVQVSALAAGPPTTITMRLCLDAAGDNTVIPDTTATIAVGLTTTTVGAVAYSVKVPIAQTMAGELGNFYLFVHGDTGTFTLDSSTITWSES
jgi:hypothetical protein